MANVIAIAKARGKDRGMSTETESTRLGSVSATGHANTHRTKATAHVEADGSGYLLLERKENEDWIVLAKILFDSEEKGNVVTTRLHPRADQPPHDELRSDD